MMNKIPDRPNMIREFLRKLENFSTSHGYSLSHCMIKSFYIAILAGVVNFLPHPNPPLTNGRE